MTETQELVLKMMSVLIEREALYNAANAQLRALNTDFPITAQLMDCELWRPLMNLLDSAAGDASPSYFLEEACNMKDGGATIEADGTRWPIRTLDDVRAYLEHVNTLQAAQPPLPPSPPDGRKETI